MAQASLGSCHGTQPTGHATELPEGTPSLSEGLDDTEPLPSGVALRQRPPYSRIHPLLPESPREIVKRHPMLPLKGKYFPSQQSCVSWPTFLPSECFPNS